MKKRFVITAGVILALVMITGVIWAQKNSGNKENAQNEMNSLPENITMTGSIAEAGNVAEAGNTADASAIKVAINGEPVSFTDIQPYFDGSAVMLPVNVIARALGASVSGDGVNTGTTLFRGNNVYLLKEGSSTVYVNGEACELSAAAAEKNGSVYVPADFVRDVFGLQTFYDNETAKLSIRMETLPVYFAGGFQIKYLDNGCKLVTDGENFRLLLAPQGRTAPEGYLADKKIDIPLKNVVACSATYVGELAKLNLLDSLRGVTASEKHWYIPEVKDAMNRGTIKYLGGDNMEAPDYELIKALSPDMVFAYTGAYGQQYIMRKLDEIGVHYAINNEYMEPDFLGRMEWIKFTAAFYNKELEAEKMFNDAVKRINDVTAKVGDLEKPAVAWGLSWGGKVYVENPDSYVGKWITMCGGDYVFKNMGKGYDTQVSMEDFYAEAKNADILIFSSTTNYMRNPSIEGIVQENPLFANIKAVQNGNVWAYAPDWWQTAPCTDIFVRDIAAVFHPEAFAGHETTMLVKLPIN